MQMFVWRIPTVLLFATLLVPLVSYAGFFFPFVTTKAFLFFALVDIATLYALFDLARGRARVSLSLLTRALGFFVFIVGLADALGVYPGLSFLSTFERMDGFLMLVHAFLFFVLLRMYFDDHTWKLFWIGLCGVGILAGVYGLIQAFSGVVRPGSTFGNPIYFAGFELFCIFLALCMYARSHVAYERYLYIGAGIVGLFSIYVSGTRGAFIGLVLGAVASFTFFVWRRFGARVFLGSFVIGVCLLSALWITLVHLHTVPASLERFTSLSLSDPTVFSRVVLAQIALEGIYERPLFGFGQEGFIDVYARHYDTRLFGYEPWHDRAHNVFIDWFVASGIIGGMLFIVCMAMLFFLVSRNFFNDPWLFGLLVAYSVYLATVFLDSTGYVVLFALAAFLDRSMSTQPANTDEHEHMWVNISVFLLSALLVGALYAPSWATARSVLDALFHTEYIHLFATRKEAASLERASSSARSAFARAEVLGSRVREVREQRAVVAIRVSVLPLSIEERSAWYRESVTGLLYNHILFENDPRQLVLLGDVHAAYGAFGEAVYAYEKALAFSPEKQSLMLALARTYYRMGDSAQARALVARVVATQGPLFPHHEVDALTELLAEVE